MINLLVKDLNMIERFQLFRLVVFLFMESIFPFNSSDY